MDVRLRTDYMKQGNDSKTRQSFFVDFIGEGYRLTRTYSPNNTTSPSAQGKKHTVSLNLKVFYSRR